MPGSFPPLASGEPYVTQIVRNIRNAVDAGRLRDGEVLPSTRELAAQWGVSVWTITEAMKLLSEAGIVENRSRSMRIIRATQKLPRARLASTQLQLVLVGGYAGSGKTEFARVLAQHTGWAVVDKDTLTRPVVECALAALGTSPHDRESDVYLNQVRPLEYAALVDTALENLSCGQSVIAAAPFIREFNDPRWLVRMGEECSRYGANLSYVWMRCDEPTMLTYLRQRGAARDTHKLNNWVDYLLGVDFAYEPQQDHTIIDNSLSSASLPDQAARFLQKLVESP